MEAKYRIMVGAVVEIIWLVGLLKDLMINIITPVKLCCDNKTTMQISSNLIFHERTKHIEIDCHFMREKIKDDLIKQEHVGSKSQFPDLLTKELTMVQHQFLLSKLEIIDIFHPSFGGSTKTG